MNKLKKPDLSNAIIKIKGYHTSKASALGAFGAVFFSIAMLIIAVEASKVFSAQAMTISWVVYGIIMLISVTSLIYGIVSSAVIKKRDCITFFNDSFIVYELNRFAFGGYVSFGYNEIVEYGFIHALNNQVKKSTMYLNSDVYNYGWLKILDTSGKKHTIPVSDIEKAKQYLKNYTDKDETIYQRLKGINY